MQKAKYTAEFKEGALPQATVGAIDNTIECWHNRQHGSPTNHFNQEHQP